MTATGALIEQAFNIDWPGPMSTYDGVLTANARDSVLAGTANRIYNMASSSAIGSAWANPVDAVAAWTTQGPVDISNAAVYRPSGGTWSAVDFANEQTIFGHTRTVAAAGNDYGVTSFWGSISYTPSGGGFVFLLQLAGIGALPLTGAMDFLHFQRFLLWRRRYHPRHTILTPEETRTAWRELREYRWPSYFLPSPR
jgi:hypothetical protein